MLNFNPYNYNNYASKVSETAESVETSSNEQEDNIKVIAHRGYSSEAPENTLAAFEKAGEYGFNAVELDISWTSDDVPVVLHDPIINRTAQKQNGKNLVIPRFCSFMSYDKLTNFDFGSKFSEDYKGTKIPTFDETLDCCADQDVDMYVEIKKYSGFNSDKAKILVDAVKEKGLENKVTWISFDEDYLKEINELLPDARLGFLCENKVTSKTIDKLKELDTEENEVFLDVKASKMNEDAAQKLDEAGFYFEAWTIDNIDDVDELYSLGCKGITTNSLLDKDVEEYINKISE